MTELQKMFLLVVSGLLGFWVIAIGYELYLRFTEKCVNCIVEDPRRLRFFKRFSLFLALVAVAVTIYSLVNDSYIVFVSFMLALYFFRLFMVARTSYTRLMAEEDVDYNPNMTISQDLRETLGQFKLLICSPIKFFNQNR